MENKQNIKEAIISFFKNKVPGNSRLQFQNWLLAKEDQDEKESVLRSIWDDIDAVADENTYRDLKEINSRINYLEHKTSSSSLRIMKIAAAVMLPIFIIGAAIFLLNANSGNVEVVQYYVPKGEIKHLLLPDGSEVWLNSDSYLSMPEKFASNNRTVNLTGEAYFQVSKDKSKPFIVKTRKMDVEVLGTKFNVNTYPEMSEMKVTLKEGSVKVNVDNNNVKDSYMLSPNEELSVNSKNGHVAKTTINADDFPDWDQGAMRFNGALIGDIFTQIEKKYGLRVAFNSKKYENRRLTVKFDNGESVDDILQILSLMVPNMEVSREDSVIYIR